MKKCLVLIVSLFLIAYTGVAQIQATIKLKGVATPSTVVVAFKSTTTLTGAILSSCQLALAIPASVSTGVGASITSKDPLMVFNPAPLVTNEIQNGVNYTVYAFNGDGTQSGAGVTYTAGVETDYAEVKFTGGDGTLTINDVRIVQLPNGGANGQDNFYVADKGTDVTHPTVQFYSTLPTNVSNDGTGYAGSSWATIGPIVLPVKFTGFDALKRDNDAMLTWQVENESPLTDRYEIERSLNGVDFRKVYTVTPKNNGRSSNTYSLTDPNLTAIRTSGVFYYHIKQIDKDGRFVYSDIKNLRLNAAGMVVIISPNPVRDIANISMDSEQDATVNVTVTDASGKQVQAVKWQVFKGQNIKKVNMAALPIGSYLLKVQSPSETKTITVVKGH